MVKEILPSEDVRRVDRRFRLILALILALWIGITWAWTASHSSHHAEIHARAVGQANTSSQRSPELVHSSLGVLVQPVTPAISKAFGLEENRGALVADVLLETPAENAGLQVGDVIRGLGGVPVDDSRNLQQQVAQFDSGSRVTLEVIRDGRPRDITVTLDELPSEPEELEAAATGGEAPQGISLQELTPEIAQQLDLPAELRGIVVATAEPGSVWSKAGLRRGDVIEEVNREQVKTRRDFRRAIQSSGNEDVLLLINRAGTTKFVVAEHD